jgi:hypothetical protein
MPRLTWTPGKVAEIGLAFTLCLLFGPTLSADPFLPNPKPNPIPSTIDPDLLESQGAIIGRIVIENANVFDPEIPEEDNWLFRTVNRLHFRTRPRVIEQHLLFTTGDRFEQRLLDESERILRTEQYLHDASIKPFRYHDGVVDVVVHTTDVWTLDPRFSFGRSGGENRATLGVRDSNLLGTGIYFGLFAKTNVDRDSTELKLADRQLGNSWYAASVTYADNSDGSKAELDIGRPFYSLDSTRAHGLRWLSEDRTDSLYDRGEVQARFGHDIDHFRIYAGLSGGLRDGRTHRYSAGVAYEADSFRIVEDNPLTGLVLPQDRKFVYPFVEWELLEDNYEESFNHDHIGKVEDRFLGTYASASVGLASESFGSLRDALLLDASYSRGLGDSESDSLLASAEFHTRVESGGFLDLLLNLGAVYHHRHSDHLLFHSRLSGSQGANLDLDHQLLLGGENGLRGYPLRYQGGEGRVLFTAEERFFTDWYPFRLVRIGGAVFFDAGRTWGENPVGEENLGWLKDVGFGLRFGNTRSGIGTVVHLDIAFPLDGEDSIDSVQLLLEGKTSF